ncbi:hypothetical protein DTO164E3_1122 [Paecilomyces variotii]|nr:hypothetical protein DTO164E3_1122 [Paecilomyces variotii]KAJ9402438.1 hypothetical protein DTO282F9_634 [Paecilomyces variotii]KAJ9404960.1 hypothetical protein DTO045G8_7286 [Paecilomyces variotii]
MVPDIAIIGAGPCGLTFARLLELNNINYIIFERDASSTPTPQHQGGTLDLHPKTGQLALKRAGLFEEYSKIARWNAGTGVVMDPAGKTYVNFDKGAEGPEIDRVQLRRLLLDSVPEEKIRWDHAVKAVEKVESGAGWVIRFADGSTAAGFKLIVGADGAWSKIRPLITPAKPVYSRKMYIEGRIPQGNPRYAAVNAVTGAGTMMAMGAGKQLAVQQVADGSYRVYLGLQVPEDFPRNIIDISSTESAKNTFLSSSEFFADWAPDLKEIIANTEGPLRSWAMHRMLVESMGWTRVRGLALIGDAAHVSTPFVGEGVNWAMYDALVLADRIVEQYKRTGDGVADEDDQLERAVAQYEEEMFPRAKDFIERCMASEELCFSEDAAQRLADILHDPSQTILGKA